jgi:hypothetical protein
MYWAVSVFIIKIAIIFRIEGINTGYGSGTYFVDGSWLGADGENYLTGYFALLKDGIFSADSILNYWPAGYPLLILFLSFYNSKSIRFCSSSCYLAHGHDHKGGRPLNVEEVVGDFF